MSVTVTSRVMWTQFVGIEYKDKNGKILKVGKPAAKLVMLAIADSADDWGENSWNSFETIAEKSSIERRSVMRVIRGLMIHKYLSIKGVSRYGTNDYKINMSMLGNAPARRAKSGRPTNPDLLETGDSVAETGDSVAETGDSVAETGDQESPNPSLPIQIRPDSSINADTKKRGDFVDLAIDLLDMPGLKKSQRFVGYESLFKTKINLNVNSNSKRWEAFFNFVDKQDNPGKTLSIFLDWLASTPKFDPLYWSPDRMKENWYRAFEKSDNHVSVQGGVFYG